MISPHIAPWTWHPQQGSAAPDPPVPSRVPPGWLGSTMGTVQGGWIHRIPDPFAPHGGTQSIPTLHPMGGQGPIWKGSQGIHSCLELRGTRVPLFRDLQFICTQKKRLKSMIWKVEVVCFRKFLVVSALGRGV